MSLADCLQTAIDAGQIDRKRAKAAQEMFREFRDRYARTMSEVSAGALAAKDVKVAHRAMIEDEIRTNADRIKTARRINEWMDQHLDLKGRNDQSDALVQLLQNTSSAKFTSVDQVERGLRRMVFRRLDQFILHHSQNIAGSTRNVADLRNVGLELEGRRTGDDQAYRMALALRDTFEEVRLMYNAAGGHIPKLENWRPQGWDAKGVKAFKREEWIADMKASLDWNKTIDPTTTLAFGSPDHPRAQEFLEAAHSSIVSGGWDKLEPSFQERGRAAGNRRADHRVLHFREGEWERIAAKYGNPDLFNASIGYISGMVRDIAMMKVLGRNPAAGLEFAIQKATKQVRTGANPAGITESKLNGRAGTAKNMLAIASGATSQPVYEGWAAFFAGTRNILSSAHLGSAIASSVSDLNTVSFAARHVGMSGSRVMARAIKNATSGRSRADMLRTIGVLDNALNTSAAMARFTGDAFGPELTRRISSGVIRASGLASWTDLLRNSFGEEFMGLMAEVRGKGFTGLPEEMQAFFNRRGITAADWDRIRTTPLFKGSDGEFIVPDDIRHRTDIPKDEAEDLAIRLQGIIEEETEKAVPSSSLEARARALGGSRPGTAEGEVRRGFFQYKAFGVTQLLQQIVRVQQIPGIGGKLGYITSFVAGMTVLGAFAIQVKAAIKGRDPEDMTTATFWARAFVQGGGFGILGDFLASGVNRFGGGFAETLAGPQVGLAQDLYTLTAGNVIDAASGRDPHLGRDVTQILRHNMPGGTLWYARLPLERLIFDQMQMMLDPEAYQHFRRQEANQRRTAGNRSFWERGDLLPSRAPNLASALGQ